MFCPKCGIQNPETGKFCRSCGTDLGNINDALSGKLASPMLVCDRKGKPISYEGAIIKFFTGIAFLAVSVALAFSGTGRGWWFWMLIPAFASLGAGVAQYVQLRKAESRGQAAFSSNTQNAINGAASPSLPPPQTNFVSPESRYKTGDLVPPSVTDNTTRHLEINKEGETMALPKRDQ